MRETIQLQEKHLRIIRPPMTSAIKITVLTATLAVAACVPPAPEPTPPPVTRPTTAPVAAPPPMVSAPPANWMDNPATPGDWSYRTTSGGSQALFGAPGTGTRLTLQCSRANRQVLAVRAGQASASVPMRILTESSTRTVTATPDNGGTPGLIASFAANDPFLDAMAISKGRFAVEVSGLDTLYIPSWPEVTRVIEDCR